MGCEICHVHTTETSNLEEAIYLKKDQAHLDKQKPVRGGSSMSEHPKSTSVPEEPMSKEDKRQK